MLSVATAILPFAAPVFITGFTGSHRSIRPPYNEVWSLFAARYLPDGPTNPPPISQEYQ